MLKSMNIVVTEQTIKAFDWKLIGFIKRVRIHWNFSHNISMACVCVGMIVSVNSIEFQNAVHGTCGCKWNADTVQFYDM